MNKDCDVISELWAMLNPHCQVHGCEVDPTGTVTIWILFARSKAQQPLELCIGNPPKAIIRSLKNAVREAARAKRLTSVTGGTIISGETGTSNVGEIGRRDK